MALSRRRLMVFGFVIVLPCVLLGVFWFGIPRWLESKRVKEELCRELSRWTGADVTLDGVRIIRILPLELEALNLLLKDQEGTAILTAPKVLASVQIMGLFRGETLLTSLTLEGVTLTPHIMTVLGNIRPGNGPSGLMPFKLGIKKASVDLSYIGLEGVTIKDMHLESLNLREDGAMVLSASGKGAAGSNEGWPLRITGIVKPEGDGDFTLDLREISLAHLRSLFPSFLKRAQVSGMASMRLKAEGRSTSNLKFEGEVIVKDFHVEWDGILDVPYEAEWARGWARGALFADSWEVGEFLFETKELHFTGCVSGGTGGLRGELHGSGFPFQRVIPYLGSGLIGHALQGFFRKDLLGGVGRGVTFNFSIDPSAGLLDLLMKLPFEGASVRFDPNLSPLEDISGVLFWKGDKVWFEDLKGVYRSKPFQRMEAKITEIGKVSLFEGVFSIDLGWPELDELFSAVSGQNSGTRFLSQLEGSAKLALGLRKAFLGNKAFSYQAELWVKEARGTLDPKGTPWRAVSGHIRIGPENMTAEGLKGTLGSSSWEAVGQMINWPSSSREFLFEGLITGAAEDLAQWLDGIVKGVEIVSETRVPIQFLLTGKGGQVGLKVEGDLTGANLNFRELWQKKGGEVFRAFVRLQRAETGMWMIQEALFQNGSNVIKLIPSDEGGEGGWLFVAEAFPVEKLKKRTSIVGESIKGGSVEVRGRLSSADPKDWEVSLRPKGVEVTTGFLGKSLVLNSGSLVLGPQGMKVEGLELKLGERDFHFAGFVRKDPSGRYCIRGGVRGEYLSLDSLFGIKPEGKKGPDQGTSTSWSDVIGPSELGVALRRMSFLGLSMEAVQARLEKGNGRFILKECTGTLSGGRLEFTGEFHQEGSWEARGHLEGARASDLFSQLGIEETLIEGTLGMEVHLGGSRGREGGDHTLRGEMALKVEKGIIRRFPLIATILSMMNLTQLLSGRLPEFSSEGMVFNSMTGTFHLDQGMLHTKDFRVESEAVVLTMVGDIDLRSKECDLKVGAQPFVGMDRLVGKLPIIRHYLAGPKKTTFATYFLVKGPLRDPEVTPIPFQSLGEALMGIFLRLFQNPFKDLGPPAEKIEESLPGDNSP